jgi:hypothetical protein
MSHRRVSGDGSQPDKLIAFGPSHLGSITQILRLNGEQKMTSRPSGEWLELEMPQVDQSCAGIVGHSLAIRTVLAAIKRFAPYRGPCW